MRLPAKVRSGVVSLLLVLGFVQPLSAAENFKADLSLLRDYSPELAAKVTPCRNSPFVARFKKGDRELTFVAAMHGTGPEHTNLNFRTIRSIIQKEKPGFAIIEALKSSDGPSPEGFSRRASECAKDDFKTCPEIHFTAYLAKQNSISFQGGEPTDEELIKAMGPKYRRKDFACLMWMIALGPKLQNFEGDSSEAVANREGMTAHIQPQSGIRFTFDDFVNCYEAKMADKFAFSNIDSQTFRPDSSPAANFFQKAMFAMDSAREPNIAKTISASIGRNKKTLVVYGMGHFIKQAAVWGKLLGKPKFECVADRPERMQDQPLQRPSRMTR